MAERKPTADEERREFHEEHESLWRITLAPATWAGHFVISYAAAAVVCAKTPGMVDLLRLGIGALTLLALGLILWLGWRAWVQWDVFNTGDYHNSLSEAEDRHQFLGHAAVLLALVSAIGVIYVSLPALFFGSCQ